ncbi:MAG TPA: hypothetical protein VGH51_15710 [Candidatus Angelobacter sp.]
MTALSCNNMPEDKPVTNAGTQDATTAPPSPGDAEVESPPPTKQGEPMEIHAPDKPIHSKKDFLFHMLTVVLGILIALALDGIVTWAHHRVLVREARANIATELRENKEAIQKALPEIQDKQKQAQHILATIEEVEKNPKFDVKELHYSFESYDLYFTAWKTASVSGAVTHMNYEELKNYTDVYDLQQDFMTLQSQGFSQIGDLVAAMHVLNRDRNKIPLERLDDIQRAAERILLLQKTLENVSVGLVQGYEKALK